jgi:hypothetical protein
LDERWWINRNYEGPSSDGTGGAQANFDSLDRLLNDCRHYTFWTSTFPIGIKQKEGIISIDIDRYSSISMVYFTESLRLSNCEMNIQLNVERRERDFPMEQILEF